MGFSLSKYGKLSVCACSVLLWHTVEREATKILCSLSSYNINIQRYRYGRETWIRPSEAGNQFDVYRSKIMM